MITIACIDFSSMCAFGAIASHRELIFDENMTQGIAKYFLTSIQNDGNLHLPCDRDNHMKTRSRDAGASWSFH